MLLFVSYSQQPSFKMDNQDLFRKKIVASCEPKIYSDFSQGKRKRTYEMECDRSFFLNFHILKRLEKNDKNVII